jgi:hypothetical protein
MASTFEALLLAQANLALNPPIAVITQNTLQSIPNSALTALTFDGSVYDTYNGHSTVTQNTRYTAQVPGYYFFVGAAAFASNTTGARVSRFFKNGTGIVYSDDWRNAVTAASTPTTCWSTLFVQMAVGDYVELDAYQTITSGALNTIVSGPQSVLNVFLKHL